MDSSSRQQKTSTSTVEEDAGVLKSGVVTAGFTPIKSKKCYYAILCERALELHESEKSQKKKRHAKHLVDLSTCFNIDRHVSEDFYGVYIVACDIQKRRPNRTDDATLVGR
uniref:Transposase n=1 Tax=Ascaris lumbricoides TaxID=6252 RepID=A0A0M3I405_ASCLU